MNLTKSFDFGDVLGYGWRVMKANFWFFVGVGIIWVLMSYLLTIIDAVQYAVPFPEFIHGILSLILRVSDQIISIVMSIGIVKIALSFCDERKPSVGTLFAAMGCFWRYVAVMILYMLIVIGGCLLLIVPGIIWAVKYQYGYYFVIDKGFGPIEALKASSKTTMGVKWELLGFFAACGVINLLGLLCLVVGLFATYPVALVATALVYRQLAAQTFMPAVVVQEG